MRVGARDGASAWAKKVIGVLDLSAPWRQVLEGAGYAQSSYGKPGVWHDVTGTAWEVAGYSGSEYLVPIPDEDGRSSWLTCGEAFTMGVHGGDIETAAQDLMWAAQGSVFDASVAAVLMPSEVLKSVLDIGPESARHDLPEQGWPSQALASTSGGVAACVLDTDGKPEAPLDKGDIARGIAGRPENDPGSVVAATGCEPLEAVRDFLKRFLALPSVLDYDVLALWVAHTHLIDCFDVTPRLAVVSAQPGSGKTRVLDLLERLTLNAVPSVSSSPSSIFRSVAASAGRITLLLDEADTLFQHGNAGAEETRGILNGGYKRGGAVLRSRSIGKGPDFEAQRFPVFSPVAFACLGRLPDTLMSRSIVLNMRRRRSGEIVEPLRFRETAPEAATLLAGLAGWAQEVAPSISVPEMPAQVTDRSAEIWEPMLSVAQAAGSDWLASCGVAAVAAVADAEGKVTRETALLGGLLELFDELKTDRIHSAKLLALLEERDLLSRGELDGAKLATLLRPFGVSPKMMRIQDENRRGYERGDFVDLWARYL